MAANIYSAGTAFLTVVPSFKNIEDAFKAQVREMAKAADKDLAAGMAKGLRDAQKSSKANGAESGKDFAGAYNDEAKKRLTAAWKALPEPQPGVNMRKWDKALAKIRSEMKDLAGQVVGVDIDQKTFDRAIDDFRLQLQSLRDYAPGKNRDVSFFNADQSAKALEDLQRFTEEASRRAGDGGHLAGSSFVQQMAKVLRDGLSKVPPIRVTADSSDAETKLAELRDRMGALQSRRIGVDIDAGAAYAELRAIHTELQRLDRTNVRVDIRTNAHEASAGMGQFIAQAEKAGQATGNIGGRANFSLSRLEYLIALGASLGTAIVPAAASAVGAIGLIGTTAIAGASGLGVLALGLSGISDAVKALNGYEQDQKKSANSVQQANDRVASSTDQVRMAQLSLVNTRRNVAEAAEDAARRVVDAERGVTDARRSAAQESVDAARAVRDARRAAADAEDAVGDARRQRVLDLAEADRQVRDAQRGVTNAEQDAREARAALNAVIREAVRDMRELDTALARNGQEQSKATTAQMEALEELNKLKTNPRATNVEIRQAQDSYNEQTVRLKELKDQQTRLREEKARADKLGVEGDKNVIAARKRIKEQDDQLARAREKLGLEEQQRTQVQIRAQERISDAQERVARAQEQVARAQQQQAESEVRSQQRIQDAQRRVADAKRQQSRQALDGEYQLVQATNAVSQAQRSQQQAWDKTATAGGEALEKLNESMAGLTPKAQHFAKFIFGLKDEMLGLRAAASDPLLPALEEAINVLLPYLPAVKDFIGRLATVVGELAIRAAKAFGDPVWQRFFGFIDKTAGPSLETLYEVGQNVTQGLLSLFLALTPFNGQVATGLVDLSRDFALWAERLDKSQGYQDFLEYVRTNGPKVVHFLGEVGELLIDLVKAAAPLGAIALKGLTVLVRMLNSIPTGALTFLILGIGAVSLALAGLSALIRVRDIAGQLNSMFGPKASRMIQTYAIETGRATEQTGRFGKAAATAGGLAQATRDRITRMTTAVGDLGSRMVGTRDKTGPLSAGIGAVGKSVDGTTTSLNGPSGLLGAVQTAQTKMTTFGTAAGAAATGGLAKAHRSIFDVAAAANGPGGLAAGASNATTKVAGLGRAAGTAATALGGKMVAGASSAVAFLGGPWTLAIAAAAVTIGYFATKSDEQKAKVQTLTTALGLLATEYRDLAGDGKQAGKAAEESFQAIVRNNPALKDAVIALDGLGVSFDQMVKASTSGDPSAVIKKLNDEIDRQNTLASAAKDNNTWFFGEDNEARAKQIESARERIVQLSAMRDAFKANATEMGKTKAASDILNSSMERGAVLEQARLAGARKGVGAQRELIDTYDRNAARIEVLNGLVNAFTRAESDATLRAKALRAAIDEQTGAAVTASEQEELFSSKILALRDQITLATDASGKHSRSLDTNTQAGLHNRDALEDAASSIREMYLQDIASGKPMKDATDAHTARIKALKAEAEKLHLTKSETDKLIAAYGGIPDNVTTVVSMEPGSFDTVYRDLQRLQFMQSMLKIGADPAKAEQEWKDYQREVNRALLKRADGGPIVGPGTKTSDSVLMYGSNGEWVHKAEAVDYYGDSFMSAINEKRIPRESLPGFATGGKVRSQTWPYKVDISKTLIPDESTIQNASDFNGALGGTKGGRGYKWQMAVLRQVFPGLELISGPRPGSRTLSGNLSWHSRNRAVDVPAKRKVAEWIAATYGKNTLELITPWRDLMLHHGKPHKYSPAIERQHGVGSAGNDHIHWAYDQGGWLPPGESTVLNATGKPEPVLTDQQWKTIAAAARGGDGAASVTNNHYQFRDTTLDAGKLQAMQDRDAFMAREGRAR